MSSFETELKEFAELSRRYPGEIRNLKSEGSKVVAWYGSYIPLEIIHASGAIPYPLFDGGDPEPVEAALQYLTFCTNAQARYQVGQHVMELNPITVIADRIVIDTKEADSVRVGNAFEFLNMPVMYLGVPQDWEAELAFNYYKRQLGKLSEELKKLTGEAITNAKLAESAKMYNRMRGLLSEIGSLRKEQPPVIAGEDFIRLNHYALRSDPDAAIAHLEKIVESLKGKKSRFSRDARRIMVTGRGFATGDYTLLRIVEESGGVVVTELLDEGFVHPEKVKLHADLMQNIAERYYREKVPSTFMSPSWAKRWKRTSELIDEYRVGGLLYYELSFDVIYDHEYPTVAKRAEEKGIPFAMVESAYEFSREATGPLRTRVESFLKICRG